MDHKYIVRMADGWWVRFCRGTHRGAIQATVEAQKFYSFRRHGGEAGALRKAIQWRDEYLKTRAPEADRTARLQGKHDPKLRCSNTSGVVGVNPRHRRGVLAGWVATWVEWKNGERFPKSKTFPVHALAEAARWRKRMVKLHSKGPMGQ